VVDTYIGYLACGLINVINIFQPEILCIGGGICKEGDTLLKPLEAQIKRERYSKFSSHQTRLCVAELGNNAGIIGAACLG
jgi:glucokinase